MLSARDYLVGATAPAHGHTLARLFASVVAAEGERPAITAGGSSLSWEQWGHEAEALGRGLQGLGVGRGQVAAVQLPNGRDFLTVHVALGLIGAVMLPLHPAIGPADAAALIERSGAELLLCTSDAPYRRLQQFAPCLRHVVVSGTIADSDDVSVADLITRWSGHRHRPVLIRPDDPFVLVASSGTTANRPKICVHSHHGLLANAVAAAEAGELGRDDVLVCASPFAHLFGLFSVHLGLVTGAAQAVLPAWDADRFLRLAAEVDASTLLAVPTQLEDLAGRLARTAPEHRPRLREIRTGGAAVPARLVTRLTELTGAAIVVQWGMSELGASLYTHPADPPELAARSIGRPAPGVEVQVVDADGAELGEGCTGELRVRSPYAFRGYLGDPVLTEAALPTDGWLRTGDLAARLSDGTFAFRGRSTDVINVGGQKVNALELEELLADFLPGLGPIAVVGRPDERLGEYPCLVVTAEVDAPNLDDVLRHLATKGVSEYKYPVEIVRIERLPLTPTGKIARGRLLEAVQAATSPRASNRDRRAVLDKVLAHTGPSTSSVDRRTALGKVLAHTSAILGNGATLSADLAFREAGLSSVGAVRLARALGTAFGRELASTVVFDHPTPAALADYLTESDEPSQTIVLEPWHSDEADDPVVVVGMSCRLPGGVDSPRALWSLLVDGGEVIDGLPTDRGWPLEQPYAPDDEWDSSTRCHGGGFLADPGAFDAGFFGITPQEALAMDPQQRITLEVAWEALESAGIPLDELRGTDTGVFLGMMASDYAPRVLERPAWYLGQSIIGNSAAVASGRIAYFLGVHGQAVTVDSACSSSLVAIHQARRAIELGECARALVGGVTVMSTPASLIEFGRQGALSADGRCKAFGAGADGAGWSEGAGVLVLETLSAARRAGHRVLAVLSGGAVNQDGASNGLTAPNGLAQQAVIRAALADAGLRPADVSVVEAHGTGTVLGDPIEARAIQAVYGVGRDGREESLWLGSVKSNLGHTQAAAGVVGVIKMILAFQHELLPRTLHAEPPTPHVDWTAGSVRILSQPVEWPRGPRPRRAGISAFGIGGTNAHLVLEEPPNEPAPCAAVPPADSPRPWLLSARTPRDLQETARRLIAAQQEQPRLRRAEARESIGYVLARRRTSFPHRAAVLPDADGDYTAGLEDLARGHSVDTAAEATHLTTGHVERDRARNVFVFPGHGSQWPAMGRELLRHAPAFAQAVAACDEALYPYTGWSVRDYVSGSGPEEPTVGPEISQPALFAMMVGLAALWESYGVKPTAVLGHSQGEIAAAYVAGALSLSDAAKVVAVRSRLLGRLVGHGTMMAGVRMSADEARRRIEPWQGLLEVAAVNGPRSVVISGEREAMDGFRAAAAEDGVDVRPLRIDFASHCAQVDAVLPDIEAELVGISPQRASVPFFSTVDGCWLDGEQFTPAYWCRNLRLPVGFYGSTRELASAGYDVFLEVSPHPVLTQAIEQTADELGDGTTITVLDTLRRDEGGLPRFLRAFGEAYCHGANIDRTVLYPGTRIPSLDLPTYPFQHRRYWPDDTTSSTPPSEPPEQNTPLPAPQTEEQLLTLVREQSARVAGFDDVSDIAPDGTFASMGFSSLASTRIAAALSRATGVRVPPDILLDQPTPRAVSRHLARLLKLDTPQPPSTTLLHLSGLVSAACSADNGIAAIEILKAASLLRTGSGLAKPASPVTLTTGPREPILLFFPSVTTLGGPAEYAALAAPFAGSREVHVLPQPGFAEDEPLPLDLESSVAAHVSAVRACAGDRPFVLCGHSSGGWVAHAVAERCAAEGRAATGTILLDSFWPDEQLHHRILPQVVARLAEPARALGLGAAGLARLSAVGAYLRFFGVWTPRETTSPTLFIGAETTLSADLPPARWQLPHELVTVPANHFDMLTSQSTAIAEAIEGWLAASLERAPACGKNAHLRR